VLAQRGDPRFARRGAVGGALLMVARSGLDPALEEQRAASDAEDPVVGVGRVAVGVDRVGKRKRFPDPASTFGPR